MESEYVCHNIQRWSWKNGTHNKNQSDLVDALVVDGMKNKLVDDSEQQEQKMGGAVDSEVVDGVDEPKSRSSTWILVDGVNTWNKLEHRDRSYTGKCGIEVVNDKILYTCTEYFEYLSVRLICHVLCSKYLDDISKTSKMNRCNLVLSF